MLPMVAVPFYGQVTSYNKSFKMLAQDHPFSCVWLDWDYTESTIVIRSLILAVIIIEDCDFPENDGTRGFSKDQLKGKHLSLTFRPNALVIFRAVRFVFIFNPENRE